MKKADHKTEHSCRISGEERRCQILQTAISLFAEKGFSGTTTKEIAQRAGVSEAMVFRHFARKSDIYDAILDNRAAHEGMRFPWENDERILRAIREKDDFTLFYTLALIALNKQQADVSFIRLLFYSALEEHELAARFFNGFVMRMYSFIGEYIKERQRDGAYRQLDPKVAVRAFMGMIIHHSINVILWDKGGKILDLSNEEAAKNFTEILLKGIMA